MATTADHVLIIVLISFLTGVVLSRHYYVKPTESSSSAGSTCQHYYSAAAPLCTGECPQEDATTLCETLEYYMENQREYFLSNTVIYFLEGVHRAPSGSFFINHVNNLSFIGLSQMVQGFHETVKYSKAIIECEPEMTSIVILSSSNILFSLISIKNCGRNLAELLVNYYFYQYIFIPFKSHKFQLALSNASIATFDIYNITISNTSVQNSYGYGFLAVNTFNMIINESSFANSNFHVVNGSTKCFPLTNVTSIANLAIYFLNPIICPANPPLIYYLKIVSTNVSFGNNLCLDGKSYFAGAGLRIVMEQSGRAYGIDTFIDQSTFYGNTAAAASNIMFETSFSTTYYVLSMTNSISTRSNVYSRIREINATLTSGMVIMNSPVHDFSSLHDCNTFGQLKNAKNPIVLQQNTFTYNMGSSISIYYISFRKHDVMQNIVIQSTDISKNVGYAGLEFMSQLGVLNAPVSFLLHNVSVTDNVLSNTAIVMISAQNATMKDVSITGNTGSGVTLLNSILILTGQNITFRNNSSTGNGGALLLMGNSYILLSVPYNVFVINNHAAAFGGAIFVNTLTQNINCFLQEIYFTESTGETNSIIYANNSAAVTGSVLYGGNIETCVIAYPLLSQNGGKPLSQAPISFLKSYNKIYNDSYGVSSNAGRVCFCEESEPSCNVYSIEREAYPGDDIDFMLVVVGQTLGVTIGTIKIDKFIQGEYSHTLTTPWEMLRCNSLSYSIDGVQSTNDSVKLHLSVFFDPRKAYPGYLDMNISVLVEVLDCPAGFKLSSREGICDCDQPLVNIDDTVTCNIKNNTITRSNYVWIGYDSNSSCLIIHNNCPFDYCRVGQVTLTISQPDDQCANNRSGLLCGQCTRGTSVLLGSNRCAKCSNAYTGLLLVFAAAGIVLIMMMLLLNLTVTLGTFNGLVFFANIVKLYDYIFFPDGPIPFISHFISWVNLDFGIESCLFDGMNDYVKVWFQFAFPLFIWTVIGAIVFLSRYTKFNKLIGRNAIKGLATLVLLSFTKLLRTVTLCLSSVTLTCEGSNKHEVHWYIDPNVVYFSKQLAPLFAMAIGVTLILILPYTVFLLVSQIIEQHINKLRCLRRHWLSIKPFFDAYSGPYKDKYRFWTGLLLITRVCLLCVILFTTTPSTAIAAIITTTTVLLIFLIWIKGVYKQWCNDVMESGHMSILVLMCCLHVSGYRRVGTILGISLVIAVFLFSLLYHLVTFARESDNYKKCKQGLSRRRSMEFIEYVTDTPSAIDLERVEMKAKSTSVVSIAEREPLIYDGDDDQQQLIAL